MLAVGIPSVTYIGNLFAQNDDFGTDFALVTEVNQDERTGGPEIALDGNDALSPQTGALGAGVEVPSDDTPIAQLVSKYVVRRGDTLSELAEKFGVTEATIRAANDLIATDTIRVGQSLEIPPINGVAYVIEKGDTLSGIAEEFDADADEIIRVNYILDAQSILAGEKIFIPDGELAAIDAVLPSNSSSSPSPTPSSRPRSKASSATTSGKYIRPVSGIVTQWAHGPYEAVDVGAPEGTPVYASAGGIVVTASSGGWGGGYGSFVVIKHDETYKSKTLYAHLSEVLVHVGQTVSQGDLIGRVGSTGRSTGPHLHFEVRGDPNPVPTPQLY